MNTQMRKFIILVGIVMMITPTIANSEPTAGATQMREADGATMVYVPSGKFLMGGSEEEGYADEWPQHVVSINGFWIDRTEVTNHQFEMFIKATDYRTDAENEGTRGVYSDAAEDIGIVQGANWQHPEGAESNLAERLDDPAIQVTWRDADAYCRWTGGRLPTEAEWEKAAGGSDGRRYPWGNDPLTCKNVVMRCGQPWKPMAVGSKPSGASLYGGVDMLGNVAEWVSDLYAKDAYHHSATNNPTGPATGMDRVLRGGSWTYPPSEIRRAVRWPVAAGFRSNASGFRCALPTAAAPSFIVSSASKATPPQIGHHQYKFEWNGEHIGYLLYLPENYEHDTQKRWPLILFLHGGGDKGDTRERLWYLSMLHLPGVVRRKPDFPFIVLSPQLSTYALNWYAALDILDALLDQIVANYRIDTTRLSVMGVCTGGEGVLLMVTRKRPDRFAAAVSIAAPSAYYLDQSNACLPKDVAFWVFHGDQDKTIPISNSEALVKALKACGAQVQYTVFPGKGHKIWDTVYNDPAVYDWLLQQHRQDK